VCVFPGLATTKFQGFPGLTKLVFKDFAGHIWFTNMDLCLLPGAFQAWKSQDFSGSVS